MCPLPDRQITLSLARILWDYNVYCIPPVGADLLLVMGANDTSIANYAADIDQVFNYSHIVVSGGVFYQQSLHQKPFAGIEAEVLAQIMVENGADSSKIILEKNATNTGENVTLTRGMLRELGIIIKTGQLVHTPAMQRRALATAEKQWPEVKWSVAAREVTLESYIKGLDENYFLNALVANTAKAKAYAEKGFQTPQPMPDEVTAALRKLVAAGFTKSLPDNFNL